MRFAFLITPSFPTFRRILEVLRFEFWKESKRSNLSRYKSWREKLKILNIRFSEWDTNPRPSRLQSYTYAFEKESNPRPSCLQLHLHHDDFIKDFNHTWYQLILSSLACFNVKNELHTVSRTQQSRHREPSIKTPFPTFRRVLEALRVEWRNSTPQCFNIFNTKPQKTYNL